MSEIERKYQELIEFIKQNKEAIENEKNTYREGMGNINNSDLNQRNNGLKKVFDSQSNISQIEKEINNKIAEFISEFGELTDLGIQNIEEYYLNADNVLDARQKANNREETYQRYGGEKAKANLDKARQKLDDFEKNFEKSGDFTQLEENVETYRAILEKIKNDEEMQGLIKGEELSEIQDKIETIERFVAREKEDLNKNEEENSLTEEEKRVIENNLKTTHEKLKGVKAKALKKPNDPLYKNRIEAYQKKIDEYQKLLGDYNKEQEDNTKYEIITTQRDEDNDNNQLKVKNLETELANLKTTLAQYEKNGGASPEDIAKLRAVIKRKEDALNKILGKNGISENLNDDNRVLKIEDKQFKLSKEISDLQEKYKQYQENGQLSPEELDKIKKAIYDKAEELKRIKQLESGDDENENQYLYKEKEIDSDVYLRNFQEEINALKSDMIDKFYGNSEKEKLYNSAMKRLKEHEVKENINGKEYIVKVDEYPEKESDMKFLQLELYEEKLQRLAKNALNPKAKVYSSDEEKAVDEQYVKTRNFAYDRKKATTENLVTLGKYGEKYPYLSLQSDKDRGVVANNLIKAAKVATNGLILSRNAVATISRAIGKPISKVYKAIAPDKAAIYANKPTHRYEERKTYFMQEENKRLTEEGKSLRPFRTLMKSRIKAIVNYKEGNAAILESGYEDMRI